jgi:hypothetical protein
MAFGKIKRSAALLKQAWGVLRDDPALAVFPVLSGIATLLVIASFVTPVLLSPELRGAFESLAESERAARHGGHAEGGQGQWMAVAILFTFYLVTSFVTIFFNAALLGAADRKFRGQPTGVGVGLSIALQRLPQIAAWSLLSAIIGTVLRLLEERVGFLGRIAIALVGAAWAIASYFAVPALVVEGLGPIDALKRSAETIRKSWGESLALGIGFGIANVVVTVSVILTVVAAIAISAATGSAAVMVALLALAVLELLSWVILATTLRAITQAALYRYATDGVVPNGFDAQAMQAAFVQK